MSSQAESELASILSPFRRVPAELLVEIFSLCTWLVKLDTREPPWVFGQVCGYWRVVATATPALWKRIHISLDDNLLRLSKPSPAIPLVELLLQRSGTCLITVSISCDEDEPHPALELLIQEAHRWEEADLQLTIPLLLCIGPIKNRLSSLRTLSIFPSVWKEGADEDETPILDAFTTAPLLRKFALHRPDSLSVIVPWEQLTKYYSSYADLPRLATYLSRMQNLVICDLDRCSESITQIQNPIHLPHLRCLSISDLNHSSGDGDVGDLLDCLVLPVLHKCVILCHENSVFDHLSALISRSSCSLQIFAGQMPGQTVDGTVLRFLQQTPTLTSVTLVGDDIDDEVIVGLNPTASFGTPSLPNLVALSIFGTFSISIFTDMVRTRFGSNRTVSVACLEFLGLTTWPRMSVGARAELMGMRDDGLGMLLEEEDEEAASD